MCLLGFKIHYFPELLANVDLTRWSDFHYHFVIQLWPFQQFWLKEFIVWIWVGWEILDLSCPWQRVSPDWPGGPRKILASGVPVLSRRPLIHHWGGDAVSTRSLLSMDGRSSNTVSPLWIIHFRKRSGLIYNYRESVPVKIDSLSLLVEGKENWTIFFLGHIVEYLKPATKAPHKLEVKIAKSPFISHASLKGKEQFALHPVCAAFGQRGRLQL